jgi:anti-anti-sigma factor
LPDRPGVEQEPVVVRLSGELDAGDSSFTERLLEPVDRGERYVIADMLNVSFIDSSVIRALVLVHRGTVDAGGWLRIVYTHHIIRRVIDMCGLTELLPQYATVESARRGVVSSPPAAELSSARDGDGLETSS